MMTYEQQLLKWEELTARNEKENERFVGLMDRLEKFLDAMILPEEPQGAVNSMGHPIDSENYSVDATTAPVSMDEVLAEMATSGQVTPLQMRKLVASIRPILEENAKLKADAVD